MTDPKQVAPDDDLELDADVIQDLDADKLDEVSGGAPASMVCSNPYYCRTAACAVGAGGG